MLSDALVYAGPVAGGGGPAGAEPGGGGFVEGAVGVVGGEVFAVKGAWGCAACYGAGSFVKLEADGAGNGLLGVVYKGVQGGFEGCEPEAVVGELGVALLDRGFEA